MEEFFCFSHNIQVEEFFLFLNPCGGWQVSALFSEMFCAWSIDYSLIEGILRQAAKMLCVFYKCIYFLKFFIFVQ